MYAHAEPGRLPQLAAAAVLAFSVLLAGVEIGRIAVTSSGREVVIAVVATAIFLPPHIWHLRNGLRGKRPPRSGRTLAVVAAAQIAALLLIGPAWSFMLAALATSALIVLRPRWSLCVFALCAAAPALAYVIHPDLTASFDSSIAYLALSVVFRASIQFTLVWLAAATHQLAVSRAALAQEAAEAERARVEADVRASLERGMGLLAEAARRAWAAMGLAYDCSKLANLLFTYELQHRLEAADAQMSALAAHPGNARTGHWRTSSKLERLLIGSRLRPLNFWLAQSARDGALATLRAAVDPAARGGDYYGPGGEFQYGGSPVLEFQSGGSPVLVDSSARA